MNFCKDCHATAFVYDATHGDRICTNCGLCSAYELSDVDRDLPLYTHVSTYKGENYFRIVVDKAVMAGLRLTHGDKEWVVAQYRIFLNIFNERKRDMGRKSFPAYNYMLRRILELRGIDGRCVKLPKLQKTMDRMHHDWAEMLDVYNRTIFRQSAREWTLEDEVADWSEVNLDAIE